MEETANARKLHLRVLTPTRVVYDSPVDLVVARTTDGDLGIQRGHERCTALLSDGALRIVPDKREQEQEVLMVFGGVLTVKDNTAVVMTDLAESPDKLQDYIDRLSAEREANIRKEQLADLQVNRLERAIRQALVHVDINPFPAIRKQEDD
ncbi:MAG: F0F1 ATP synthase subunit epsilon [Clostridiales bacterium]|nr:F0F1 ATP synthase subunit epsilon [Clostridiales bacterium]